MIDEEKFLSMAKITKKITRTTYVMEDSHAEQVITKRSEKDGWEIEDVTKVMPRFSLYKEAKTLDYLNETIHKLSSDDALALPVFLLRAQFVEMALKHVLMNYPYPPKAGYGKKPIEFMTMGEVIKYLKSIKDSHLDSMIEKADEFKKARNELVHHALSAEKTAEEIHNLAKQKVGLADDVEKSILFFLTYVRETLLGR